MYAIILDGARQLKVEEGQELTVDLRDAEPGASLTFDQVLAVSGDGNTRIGTPALADVSVTASVLGKEFGPKLVVQKFRRRKNSRRKTGHRQLSTRIKIEKISV